MWGCGVARLFSILICFFSVSGAATAVATDAQLTTVLSQEIEVALKPSQHLLVGVSTISFAAGPSGVSLRLSPNAEIDSVTVSGTKQRFSFSNGNLSLDIPRVAERSTVSVAVSYRARFNDPLPQHSGSSEDPTYGVHGAITTQGTFLDEASGWYPVTPTLPLQRSIRISAPAGTEALTSGRRVKRGTKGSVTFSSWEEQRPNSGLALCAGPYLIAERREAGIDLYSYFYPENAALSARYLEAAARYLTLYSDLFGTYPYEKFAVVENFFPTGYGFPSFTLLGSAIIRLPFIIDTSFPHEIAHSWWGNAVEVDQSEGNWAEGLVTYLADYLLKERRSAAEGREYRLQLLSDFATLVAADTDFALSGFVSRVDPASRTIGYGKSAMLFHMIRREIGERAFFAALREIYADRRYHTATWGDFTRAFSHSSGRDLSAFMAQWLTRPGAARVVLSNVTRNHDGGRWIVSGTLEQSSPLYDLQVPLRLETGGPSFEKILSTTQKLTPFTLSSPTEPKRLLLDPDADTFRQLTADEIPVTVNSIKGAKHLLAVITGDCRAREETFRRLLESLGKGGAKIITEEELDQERNRRNDLIFCGLPTQRSLLPMLPDRVSLHNRSFSVNAEVVQASDSLLFLVLPSSVPGGRVTALFQPLSEAAAEKYVSKITHYGKYGTLVFHGGAIRYKGTAPSSAGGSRVDF